MSISTLICGHQNPTGNPKKHRKTKDFKPMVFVTFNTSRGKPKPMTIQVLLDSGASASLIYKKFARKLKLKMSKFSTKWTTTAGDLTLNSKCKSQFCNPELEDKILLEYNLNVAIVPVVDVDDVLGALNGGVRSLLLAASVDFFFFFDVNRCFKWCRLQHSCFSVFFLLLLVLMTASRSIDRMVSSSLYVVWSGDGHSCFPDVVLFFFLMEQRWSLLLFLFFLLLLCCVNVNDFSCCC
jgi:hypothetical protein